MGEIKRLLGKRARIAIITVIVIDLLGFIVFLPRVDEEERYRNKLLYLESYADTVDAVLQRADAMLKVDIFNDAGSYSHRNIEKTRKDYTRVDNLQLEPDKDQATEAVLNYRYVSVFVYVLMLYLLYGICRERKNGMLPLTYSAGGGRKKLAAKRGIFFAAAPFIVTVLLYLLNISAACIVYGVNDFGGPIQTISVYQQYTYLHSKGFYLFLVMLKSALFGSVLSVLSYMVCNLFANVNLSLLVLGGILCVQWRLSAAISSVSRFRNLKYINIFNFFDSGAYDRAYMNTDLFGKCVSVNTVVLLTGLILLPTAFAAAVAAYKKRESRLPAILKRLLDLLETGTQKILEKIPFCMKELWKLLIIKKGIVLIAAMGFVFMFVWKHTVVTFPQRQKNMDAVYEEYGGPDWSGFEQYVSEFAASIEEWGREAQELIEKIQSGEEEPGKISAIIELEAKVNTGNSQMEEYNLKIENRNRVKEEKGFDVYLVSDRGFTQVIGDNSFIREIIYEILLLIFVILITSMSFEIERDSGVKPIFAAADKGMRWAFYKKYSLICCLMFLCFLAIDGADFFLLKNTYRLQYLNAPLQSLSFFSHINVRCTIFQYMFIQWGIRLVYMLVIQGITMLTCAGRNVENRSYILLFMIASGIVYVLCMRLSLIGQVIAAAVGIPVYAALVYASCKRWKQQT